MFERFSIYTQVAIQTFIYRLRYVDLTDEEVEFLIARIKERQNAKS